MGFDTIEINLVSIISRDKYNSYNYTLWGKTNVLYRIINSTWKGGFRCTLTFRTTITVNLIKEDIDSYSLV